MRKMIHLNNRLGYFENDEGLLDAACMIYSPPRTGSTLFHNIMSYFFKFSYKTHTLSETVVPSSNPPDLKMYYFTTIRNPIATVESNHRIFGRGNEQEVATRFYSAKKFIESNEGKAFIYEDYYQNFNIIFEYIEETFDIKIDEKMRSLITEKESLQNNKRLQSQLPSGPVVYGDGWDLKGLAYNHIHSPHRSNDIDLAAASPLMREVLKLWGYLK